MHLQREPRVDGERILLFDIKIKDLTPESALLTDALLVLYLLDIWGWFG
jgi:hypothetical protein